MLNAVKYLFADKYNLLIGPLLSLRMANCYLFFCLDS
jgi:hypothetical protein